jgi:hypothetical protein
MVQLGSSLAEKEMGEMYINGRLGSDGPGKMEDLERVNQTLYLSPKWGEPVMALPYLLLL